VPTETLTQEAATAAFRKTIFNIRNPPISQAHKNGKKALR
jgi:hypothetical protein